MSDITKLLSADLNTSVVKRRKQGGAMVSYVEGWYVIDQANQCFGFDGWQLETLTMTQVQEEKYTNDSGAELWRVGYTCRVRITALGVTRDGSGFGQGFDRDLGQAHESATKEAETDAMKRAFRLFGYRFGLALYDKSQSNVSSEPEEVEGQFIVPKDVEKAWVKTCRELGLSPEKGAEIAAERGYTRLSVGNAKEIKRELELAVAK